MEALEREILYTVQLAHNFNSAFNREQVFYFLKTELSQKEYDDSIDTMLANGEIFLKNDLLFVKDLYDSSIIRKNWSRKLFQKYRYYIRLVTFIPWITFVGLTGRNSFESCNKKDDLDIFIITESNRLWITYLLIVLISKLLGIRNILCANYLVDEDNLVLGKKSYYTAVQLMQMVPVYNINFKEKLVQSNSWIKYYIPNADMQNQTIGNYLIKSTRRNRRKYFSKLFDEMNKIIFKKYFRRLNKKYYEIIGGSMILEEGIAKLHRIDHHDIYDDYLQENKINRTVKLPEKSAIRYKKMWRRI